MTPRDIVLANLNRTETPRPGMTFDRGRLNDIAGGAIAQPLDFKEKRWEEGPLEYYDDMWGNIWKRMKDGCQGGEIHKPALTGWDQLDELKVPSFADDRFSKQMRESFEQPENKGLFKLAFVGNWVFSETRYIRNMDQYFIDMIESPEKLHRLHQMIGEMEKEKIEQIHKAGADGIIFCEDMGTQTRLLFSPDMWRQYFAELYTELFGIAHDCGLKVLMHSCGYNWHILEDLIRAGVDCFQFDQPTIYDMPKLAELLKQNKVALWSPVDIQKIMPTGDRKTIEDGAKEMVQIFEGGLICKNYPDLPGIGVEQEWDNWAYHAIIKTYSEQDD